MGGLNCDPLDSCSLVLVGGFWGGESASLFKGFDLWFLSDLLRSADFLAFDSPPSRRWSLGCVVVYVGLGCFYCGWYICLLCCGCMLRVCYVKGLGSRLF